MRNFLIWFSIAISLVTFIVNGFINSYYVGYYRGKADGSREMLEIRYGKERIDTLLKDAATP